MSTPTKDSLNQCDISLSSTQLNLRGMEEEKEIHRGGALSSLQRGQVSSISQREQDSSSSQRGQDKHRIQYSIQEIENVFKTNPHLDENIIAKQEALKNPLCDKCIGWVTLGVGSEVKLATGRDVAVRSYRDDGLNPMEIEKKGYIELALSAMEELLKLGEVNAPLWINNIEGGGETLNFDEYERAFPPCFGSKPLGFVSEGTRASSVVSMSSAALVEALLDAKQWREIFVGIIGSCTTMKVISSGTEDSTNGVLQLMEAEIQLISPLVPVRFLKFIRLTKCQADGAWLVVDLSVDDLMEGFDFGARRMPSGCILRDMPNGFSKVTWIEHIEYNEYFVPNEYSRLVRCGMGFGAQRWISALVRHCESLQTTTSPIHNHIFYAKSRRCLKDLAKSMTSIFCDGVCLNSSQQWDVVFQAPETPRIMARRCISSLGEPLGLTISAAYSVRIPAKHRQLFDLLLRLDSRVIWDPIFCGLAKRIVVSFPFNQNEGCSNCVSVLESNIQEKNPIMVLQESMSDTTGSLIVYATVDSNTISTVLSTDIIPYVPFLPIGLSIVPDYGECGSMVTLGFQIFLPNQNISEIMTETINTMSQLVSLTIHRIQETVRANQQQGEKMLEC